MAGPPNVVPSTLLPAAASRAELTDHADRLCVLLADRRQRALGFAAAQRAAALSPDDTTLALLAARCAYLSADLETDEATLVALTEAGLAAVERADPAGSDPRAAYTHAVLLGLAVRLRGLDAIGRLPELVRALEVARAAADVDLGGPLRVLGMLYLRAPAWPAGPGDLEAALELLREAVDRYPSHPLNHLFLAEALLEADDPTAARAEVATADALVRADLWGEANTTLWREQVTALAARLAP